MSVEHRGRGAPNREPAPSEAKRPENNQPTLEVGEGRRGVPPPQGERQPHAGPDQSKTLHETDEGDGHGQEEEPGEDFIFDDFCFRNPLPTPIRGFPRKGSNATTPEKE
jgi:hypothetical protein